ncbi:collagenase [Alteromonadaceae bacterium M269]|nr:collagenase [Alteromonadaceae bacterium M269]
MKKSYLAIIGTVILANSQLTFADNEQEPTEIKYAVGNVVREGEVYLPKWVRNEAQVNQVLSHTHACADNLNLRYQQMTETQVTDSCKLLLDTEERFHQIFDSQNTPVLHDNNRQLRANVYASRDDYVKYVTDHFDVPSDNGGMYLEGLPHLENSRAEYVAYLRNNKVWNLNHEFVHYLDGRFNLYGDYCAGLHDGHAGPEYCAKPAPQPPYLIWWTEGVAEYIAHGDKNEKALKLAADKTYKLSELFYNSVANWSTERVYRWGYLATRYMIEEQHEKVDEMLFFTRQGDYPRYQSLVKSWGSSMDEGFARWLDEVAVN